VTELEAQLAQAKAAPGNPDLSGRVHELEGQLISAEDKVAAAAKTAAPAYPDLSGKVAELTSEVTQLRGDRERMQQMLANAGRQLRDTSGDTARVKELETQLAAAQSQSSSLASERDASRATIARLEQEKAQLASAQPTAPAYPDLSGRVRELEAQVAARPSAPRYPDLSARVSELEAQLAQARSAPRTRPPAYPDLSGRVSELEATLASTRQQLAAAQSAPAASAPAGDNSDLAKQLAATEDRLATSLRGYAALQRERDALAESAGKSSAALTAERDALAAQVSNLNGQVDQLRSSAQSSAGSTQAELTRLGDAVAALQRSQAQTSSDLAAARTLAQQLQGANSVLAGENYQLKTALSRTTGTGATAATASQGTPTMPALRTHVVAAGDSLSRLAQRYYGNASRWQEIYNANAALLGPNGILRVGTELRIP
jgi:chromosome segregation ATPase